MKNHHVTGSLFVTLLAVSLVSFFFLSGTEEKWKWFFLFFFYLSDVITYSSESTQHVLAPSVRYFLFFSGRFFACTHIGLNIITLAVMTSSAFMANNSPDHNHKNQISRREFFSEILSAVILFTARRPVERRNRNRWMISFESKKKVDGTRGRVVFVSWLWKILCASA